MLPCTLISPPRTSRAPGAFYEEKLGFKPGREQAGGVVYEFGGGTGCFLYPTPNAGTSKASQAFWQVSDIEREVAELKARGVVFEDYDMPGREEPERRDHRAAARRRRGSRTREGNILAIIQDA